MTDFVPNNLTSVPAPPTSPRGGNMAHYVSSSGVLSTKKIDRPKSVPANFTGSNYQNKIRPKTAVGSLHGLCDRVHQLETESNNRRRSEGIVEQKTRVPAWEKLLQKHDPVERLSSPGYTLTRSRDKITMQISYDNFFNPLLLEEKPREPDEKDILIANLQQQLDDMTLFLEEERLNHKDTKKKAADVLEDKMREKDNIRLNDIRILQEEHQMKIETLHQMYKNLMTAEKDRTDAAYDKSRKEVEFLQAAFESYKTQLHIEHGNRWRQLEEETRKKLTEDLEKKTAEIKTDMEAEVKRQLTEKEREHLIEIQRIRKENKKEIDTIIKKFANAALELDRFHATENKLKECEEELAELRPECERLCRELNKMQNNFEEKTMELLAYKESFKERAHQIAEQFRQEIEDLRLENTELRQVYRKKCVEIVEQRDSLDRIQVAKLENAKDAMKLLIETRNRTNVNLTARDIGLDMQRRTLKERPSSAPQTTTEMVNSYLQAGETDKYVEKNSNLRRPATSRPRIRLFVNSENQSS